MERRFVVLCSPASIRRSGERILIERGEKRNGVPVRYIEALVIMSRVSVSSEALGLLLSNNVPVFFGTLWGKVRASLISEEFMSRNNNRLLQYEAFRKRRVEVARFIVSQKLKEIERFFRIDLRGELKALERAKDIDSLMGVEGNASKKMFDRFKENVGGCGLEFYGRSYRPPADPVNALLSLAYAFAYYLAFPIVSFLGYDPYISFLHSKRGTHASFCSDVVEFVRPLLTKHLEDVLLREVFKKEDFKRQGNGFLLKKEKLTKFLNWFEEVKEEVVRTMKEGVISLGEVMR